MYALLTQYQHLAALVIEHDPVRLGTLAAQPHHFLLDVRRQSPSQRLLHRMRVDPAGAEALELGPTSGIYALTQR